MIDFFLSYLLIYTYGVIFIVCLFASFLIPISATTILIAAGAFASQKYLNINYLLISAFFGCVIGDNMGYFISFYYGKSLLKKINFGKMILNSSRFIKLENVFQNNSIKTILLSRFLITGLCSSVNILSGLAKIKAKTFIFLDIIGEIIYVLLFCYMGFFLGNSWEYIDPILENILSIIFLIVLLTLVIKFGFYRKRKII
ncbi:MAG: DedA family protein [Candidatus Gracilibacteria bacterium]|nr:DedA family protein [Candidatus Gracilibacteria bacterium]